MMESQGDSQIPAKRPKIEDTNNQLEQEDALSSDQVQLYDRQIRLWGAEAQKRLNNARILIIGLNGLGAEVAKNIILGGVKSVVFMDNASVTELDFISQFLIPKDRLGGNRAESSVQLAQKLNPMVNVTANPKASTEEPDEYFREFDVICSIENTREENIRLDCIARAEGVAFYAADVFGLFGYIAMDLGDTFEFTKERTIMKTETRPEYKEDVVDVAHYIPYKSIVIQEKDDNPLWIGKRKSENLFGFFVLLEFFETHKRHPQPNTREDDFAALLKLRDEFCKKQGVSIERVPDKLFEFVFGQLSPVCAVTGGALAQEIVKSISKRDEPLNNLFLYNPLIGTGIVEKVE